ncbi:MAG: ACT domain-containing protein [Lachnospiraceae bacterium]|nr:ACT domain-containing protein [Lachnospiraceae bacterium]
MEQGFVSGVSVDKNIARISIINVKDEPGIVYRIYNCLALNQIKIDMIIQSGSKGGVQDISLTVGKPFLQDALDIIQAHSREIPAERVEYETGVVKVTLVGHGIAGNPSVPATLFEALFAAGVNIKAISTSEIRITVLLDVRDAEKALEAIQKVFHLK